MKLKKTVHYYKFRDIMENPLLQEKLLNKKTVFGVLSTISRYSTITRYTITRVDCAYIEYEIGKLKYRKLNTLVEFIGYMQQVYLNNSAN